MKERGEDRILETGVVYKADDVAGLGGDNSGRRMRGGVAWAAGLASLWQSLSVCCCPDCGGLESPATSGHGGVPFGSP